MLHSCTEISNKFPTQALYPMKNFLKYFSVALLLVALGATAQEKKKKPAAKKTVAAKKPAPATASVASPLLYRKWVSSYEDEKSDGVLVYRPDGYAFPPSRGRKAVSFQKDGSMVRFDIAPNDGQKIVMGRWERTKLPNTMKVTVQGSEIDVYFVEVVSVGKDMLKIRRKMEI